jgi:hypothetical protein
MTTQSDTPAKKPGRKAETPAQRLERLERDLQAARRAVKEAEHRKFATVGAAVLAEAESDGEFKTRLRDILRRHVDSKTGKADIAPLLAE